MENIFVGFKLVTVDNDILRLYFQTIDGPVHSKNGCIQDVDTVNLVIVNGSNRPCKCIFLDNNP
ncbi:hypothetical protein SDC9_194582 [bioreactor metagenome]|uniref:Uncharacterized protein n=1 Tax=bioreactor metagenome TaxID=1076179 RepID=A0A645II13_9ZZZZ